MLKETRGLRVHTITAISTAILAFAAVVGLVLALAEFIGDRARILGFGGAVWIVTTVILGLGVTVFILKRWIQNGKK